MYNKRLVSYWANLEALNPVGRKRCLRFSSYDEMIVLSTLICRLYGDIEYLLKTMKKLPGLETVPGDTLLLFFSARYGSL